MKRDYEDNYDHNPERQHLDKPSKDGKPDRYADSERQSYGDAEKKRKKSEKESSTNYHLRE
jgi:hypothetical protein